MTRKTTSEQLNISYHRRVVEETTDDDNHDHPSLPPMPAAADIVTTGETLSEQVRPLRAATRSNVIHLHRPRKAG